MRRVAMLIFGLAWVAATTWAVSAQGSGEGGRYEGASLVKPDYREWTFLAAGLGMTYAPANTPSTAPPSFTNVFVNPASYKGFMQSGKWPNGTVLMLEIRKSASEGSINLGGHFQTDIVGLEAHVKDSRFPDGWAFFNFGGSQGIRDSAEPLAPEQAARCVECHTKNGAVERTFVQFYPTLIDVARRKGTYR
jgi:hypothetical protein